MKGIKGIARLFFAIYISSCFTFDVVTAQENVESILIDKIDMASAKLPQADSGESNLMGEFEQKIYRLKKELQKYPDSQVILIGYDSLENGIRNFGRCEQESNVLEYFSNLRRLLSRELEIPENLIKTEERG